MSSDNTFSGLLAIFVIINLFAQGTILWRLASDPKIEPVERYARFTAFITGLLIFLGAWRLKITFADMIFAAITDESIIRMTFFGWLLPFVVGLTVSHLTIRALRRGSMFAIRVMIMVGVLALGQICHILGMAFFQGLMPLTKALTPNLCYSIGIGIWVVFNLTSEDKIPLR